ncbi:hypothetical protein [Shewanella colwelliana]|uniref:hypothetical protein n=1 Tax=Shewanella colwelliana TaxID=23 RepID=UPI00299E4864|nr:hypothetical protein [Shewanella colwelliana]MDX1283328.1 hypothetical protein [Shewanella colwelliana]
MTWPISDIHVIAAFVNPFTSDVTAESKGNVLAACHRSTGTNSLLQAIQNHESQRYRQRNKNQYSQMLQVKNANTFIRRSASTYVLALKTAIELKV